MSALQTGREALLAEALGDVADLLDRGEAVAATMRSAAEDLTNACTRLEAQAAAAEPRMIRLAEHTQSVAAKHIARSSHELMHEAADAECRSMASFARTLFHSDPDGHLKLLHSWPPKLLQAGRVNYAGSEAMASRAEASFRR